MTKEGAPDSRREMAGEPFAHAQTALFNALPAAIALLDVHGVIVTANDQWRRSGAANPMQPGKDSVGQNYLEICDRADGEGAPDAHRVAMHIRAILSGDEDRYGLEYDNHPPDEPRRFRVIVAPSEKTRPGGALVIHADVTDLKRTEEKLRASEAHLRTVVNSVPECVKTISVDGQVLSMNPAGLQMLEADSEDEIIGHDARELLHPDDKAAFMALHKQACRGGSGRLQYRVIGLRGTERWMETHSVPMRDLDGAITAVLSVTRDITEHRREEEVRQQNERLLAEAQRLAHVGSWEWDVVHDRVTWSAELYRIYGLEPGQFAATFETYLGLVHPDDRARVRATIEGVFHNDQPLEFEERVVQPNGNVRTLYSRGVMHVASGGQPVRLTGVCQDITEQRRAEESIRLQARILDNIGQAAIATNSAGHIIYANRFAGELYGWSVEEMLGRNILDVTVPRSSLRRAKEIMERLRRGENWSGELLVHRRDGTMFPAHVTNSPLIDDNGMLTGIIGISSDVSEAKRAEQALRESEARLRLLNDFTDATRLLGSAEQIMSAAVRLLGEHLHASRCAYASIEPDGEHVAVLQDYTDGLPSVVGGYLLSSFGTHTAMRLRSGETLVIYDFEAEFPSSESGPSFDALGVKALICYPLVKDGVLRAAMAVQQTTARDWTANEIVIVQELGERCWATIERNAAEERLRSSEALLRIAGRTARLGGWSVELSTGRAIWSDEVSKIHETPPGAAHSLGDGINFYPPEWHDRIAEVFEGCARDGTPYDEEMEILTASGRRVWVRTIGEALRDGSGTITHVQGSFQDIDEMKRSEAEARRVASQLTTTLETMTDAFYTVDENWRFTYVNSEFERLLHRDRESLLGKVVWEAFPGVVGTAFEHHYRTAIAENQSVVFKEFYPLTGVWFEVHAHPSDGGLAVYFQDVTERHLADEKLRQQEEQYRAIVEGVTNGILILDFSGRIVTANKAACDMNGYSLEELIGRAGEDLVHPADREKLQMLTAKARAGEASYTEAVQLRKDRSEVQVIINSAAFRMGGLPHLLLVISNISEQKRLQQQLERKDRISSLGRLAANIAHEMNNVMMGILPFSEIIRRHVQGDARLETAAAHIARSVERGRVITQEILRFTRAAADPSLAPLDGAVLLAEVTDELRPVLGEAISLDVHCEDGLFVRGDSAQIQQVVTNLVINARDAMPRGGHIDVTLTTCSPDDVQQFAPLDDPQAWAHLRVRDDGHGIPPHVIGQIFEPLFTTRGSGGTGLGLAIVHEIVTMHGGQIHVESAPDQGATFHVLLRKASSRIRGAESPGTISDSAWKHIRRVVLVEDDDSVADGISALLEMADVTCERIALGALAIERLRTYRPDLLILDIGLPDMSGVVVYQEVAKLQPGLLTIFSTGHGDHRLLGDLGTPANVGFLSKPYDFAALSHRAMTLWTQAEKR